MPRTHLLQLFLFTRVLFITDGSLQATPALCSSTVLLAWPGTSLLGVRGIEVQIKPSSGATVLQKQEIGLQTSASLELALADGPYVAEIWLDIDGGNTLLARRAFMLMTVRGWAESAPEIWTDETRGRGCFLT
jgi:hypothetical protein